MAPQTDSGNIVSKMKDVEILGSVIESEVQQVVDGDESVLFNPKNDWMNDLTEFQCSVESPSFHTELISSYGRRAVQEFGVDRGHMFSGTFDVFDVKLY